MDESFESELLTVFIARFICSARGTTGLFSDSTVGGLVLEVFLIVGFEAIEIF